MNEASALVPHGQRQQQQLQYHLTQQYQQPQQQQQSQQPQLPPQQQYLLKRIIRLPPDVAAEIGNMMEQREKSQKLQMNVKDTQELIAEVNKMPMQPIKLIDDDSDDDSVTSRLRLWPDDAEEVGNMTQELQMDVESILELIAEVDKEVGNKMEPRKKAQKLETNVKSMQELVTEGNKEAAQIQEDLLSGKPVLSQAFEEDVRRLEKRKQVSGKLQKDENEDENGEQGRQK